MEDKAMTRHEEFANAHMVPCARCGREAQTLMGFYTLEDGPEKQTYRIMCSVCGYQPDGTEETVTAAAEVWNRFNTKKSRGRRK